MRPTVLRLAVTFLAAVSASPLIAQSLFDEPAIGESELRGIAGRADMTQVSESKNTATVADTSVGENSLTGDVQITDTAFQNLSGLSLMNVNTGNNVAINAAMNVNIAINGGQ